MAEMLSAPFQRSELVDTSKVGDQVVLYHRASGTSLVLNATGARLWELLEESNHLTDLAARLAREFGALEAEQVVEDVLAFIRELSQHNAIVFGQQP